MTRLYDRLFLTLIAAGALLWLAQIAQVGVNGDVAWLALAALRILDGESMAQGFYDTNPPLCYLIYLPAAFLAKAGVPLWYATWGYATALAFLSLFFCGRLLRALSLPPSVYALAMLALAAGFLFPAAREWGQKDHLIAIGLVPFVLAQFTLHENAAVKRPLLWASLILFVPFILIKPHYGLLPVLMMAARVYKDRSLKSFFAADFFVLAAATLFYLAVTALYFSDFIGEILPRSLVLYVGTPFEGFARQVLGPGLLGVMLLSIAAWGVKGGCTARMAFFFSAMALAACVPVLVQMKGFSVHLLPAFALFVPTFWLCLYTNSTTLRNLLERPLRGMILVLLFFMMMTAMTTVKGFMTHEGYRASSLAKLVGHENFYVQSVTTNVVYPLAGYQGVMHASRFPNIWFMEAFAGPGDHGPAEKYFGALVAEDFERFRPRHVLMIAEPLPAYDMPARFAGVPAFAAEWRHYEKTGQYLLDYTEYFQDAGAATRKPVLYDVYRRRD